LTGWLVVLAESGSRAAKIGLVRQILKRAVKLCQIADLLGFSPLLACVALNKNARSRRTLNSLHPLTRNGIGISFMRISDYLN
jgi:hypothetical protein